MRLVSQASRGRHFFLLFSLVCLSCGITFIVFLSKASYGEDHVDRPQAPTQSQAGPSALAKLAISMQPGTWAELATNNFQSGSIFVPRGGGSILEYMDKAAWNPVNRTLMILGMSHPSSPPTICHEMLFLKYTESDNGWTNLPIPCPEPDTATTVSHGYEHVTINPETGDFFHREYNSGNTMYFSQASQSWIALPAYNSVGAMAGNYQVAGALEYFADRQSLIMVDGNWGVWEYKLSQLPKGAWKQIANTRSSRVRLPTLSMGNYSNFAAFSAARHVLIFGGGSGSSDVYRMDASGSIKEMSKAPMNIGVAASVTTVDPVSGDILVWDSSARAWDYDPIGDSWTTTGISSPIFPNSGYGGVFDVVAAPVSTYGVLMFVSHNFSKSSVYLYKHGSLGPKEAQAAAVAPEAEKYSKEDHSAALQTAQSPSAGGATGKTATSNPVDSADPASAATSSPDADYLGRCKSAGVVRCVGFDAPSDIAGAWGGNSGIMSGATTPALDNEVRASGKSSLKFSIPSKAGADTSGAYFVNFSKDLATQFGENSEFYVQWRQRFSPEFLNTNYQGGEGWKQLIIGTGDQPQHPYASCTTLEVVMVNSYQRGFPQMYNSCTGSDSHGPYDPFQTHFGAYDFKLQNARSAPYCLYTQGRTNPPSYFPKKGNCFGYFPNEWMTFQIHIKTGPRIKDEFSNSHVQLWIAREGQRSQLVIDWGPYSLSAGNLGENQQYGKVWLLPYNTNKDSSASYPTAYTWYDELIISKQRIPDPK